jgi:transketolase
MLQRDAFIHEIILSIKKGEDIYFLSADFGAAALDELRKDFPKNFLHCGISEQNMIDLATGLALAGKKVFCYAMAPFLSLRALEQIKCGPGIMNLPVCLISVGVGIGYADSGPTHYATEDFACLRSLVGVKIFTAADTPTAISIARSLITKPEFSYVRLDRHALPTLKVDREYTGFRLIGAPGKQKIALVAHGKLVHACNDIVREHPESFYAVDLVQSKDFPRELVQLFGDKALGVVAVDEQSPSGALGSAVFEACSTFDIFPRIINVTLPEEYLFENIGRDGHLKAHGLTVENILIQAQRLAR